LLPFSKVLLKNQSFREVERRIYIIQIWITDSQISNEQSDNGDISNSFFTRGIILEDFLTRFTYNLCIVVDISHVPSKIHNCPSTSPSGISFGGILFTRSWALPRISTIWFTFSGKVILSKIFEINFLYLLTSPFISFLMAAKGKQCIVSH